MNIRHLAIILLALLSFSCRTPKENIYFSDTSNFDLTQISPQDYIKIKPGDKITVLIGTGKTEFDELFNATYSTPSVGGNTHAVYPSREHSVLYTVDSDGDIALPVLGDVRVAGLTREEVARKVEDLLIENGYVQNAVAVVEFELLTVTILGEVKTPGRYTLGKDGITVIDAISQAGDITTEGNRNNIKVIREEGDKKRSYVMDFNSAQSTMGSPAYYLQQNDIIYVEPNEKRIRQSVAGANDIYTTTFWISLSSLLTSIASLIINW